jgi:hypothetical protein
LVATWQAGARELPPPLAYPDSRRQVEKTYSSDMGMGMIETMLTKKKFKDFFNNNVAAL